MIRGIGLDAVKVSRVARILETHGEAFEKRVFSESERADFRKGRDRAVDAATRFAAKEAVLKSLGAGLFSVPLAELEIVRAGKGGWRVEPAGPVFRPAGGRNVDRIFVDASADGDFAAAVAVSEGSDP